MNFWLRPWSTAVIQFCKMPADIRVSMDDTLKVLFINNMLCFRAVAYAGVYTQLFGMLCIYSQTLMA